MKDEFKGEVISEFIGSKSKMYSLITVKYLGVSKAKVVKKIMPEEFVDFCLIEMYINQKNSK